MGLQRVRRLVRPLWHAYLLWLRTDCIDLSAAFAYHTLQSIFPALLIGLSLASRWLGNDRQLLERLLHLLQQVIPASSQPVVVDALTRFLRQGFGAGVCVCTRARARVCACGRVCVYVCMCGCVRV